MANTFVRKISTNINTTPTAVGSYTVGANVSTVVVGLTISNKTTSQVTANVEIYDGSITYYVVRNAPIAVGGGLVPIGGDQKIVLQTGDSVRVSASANVDAVLSVMEFTAAEIPAGGGSGLQGDLMSLSGSEDLQAGSGTEDLNA